MAVFKLSYLLQGPLSRVVIAGVAGIPNKLFDISPRGPSTKLQDYMHLDEFSSLVNRTKTISQITSVNPANLVTFTRENQSLLLSSFMAGASIEEALDFVGIRKAQWDWWNHLADKLIDPFFTFVTECKKAIAMVDIACKQGLMMGGWKGKEALYKIRHPETAGYQQQGGTTVNVNTTNNFNEKSVQEKRDIIDKFKRLGTAPKVIDVE